MLAPDEAQPAGEERHERPLPAAGRRSRAGARGSRAERDVTARTCVPSQAGTGSVVVNRPNATRTTLPAGIAPAPEKRPFHVCPGSRRAGSGGANRSATSCGVGLPVESMRRQPLVSSACRMKSPNLVPPKVCGLPIAKTLPVEFVTAPVTSHPLCVMTIRSTTSRKPMPCDPSSSCQPSSIL